MNFHKPLALIHCRRNYCTTVTVDGGSDGNRTVALRHIDAITRNHQTRTNEYECRALRVVSAERDGKKVNSNRGPADRTNEYRNPLGTPTVREASAAIIRIFTSVASYKRENNKNNNNKMYL